MRPITASAAFGLLASLAVAPLAPGSARAADVRVGSALNWNGESNLVAQPGAPGHLVAGWMYNVAGTPALATSR